MTSQEEPHPGPLAKPAIPAVLEPSGPAPATSAPDASLDGIPADMADAAAAIAAQLAASGGASALLEALAALPPVCTLACRNSRIH